MNVKLRLRMAAIVGGVALLSAGLAGCSSSASTDIDAAGTWGDPTIEQQPSLVFEGEAGDGRYAGTDGCNRVSGEYSLSNDGAVDLGLMMSTRMYCEGVDTWLSLASTATITTDTMTFFDEVGTELGSLTRHSD